MKKGVLALVFFLYYLTAGAQINAFGLLYGQGKGEGDPYTRRYVVTSVYPGSPAARAGILPGDEIVAVNGTTVLNKTMQEVKSLFEPERAEIKVLRNNEEYIGTFEKAALDIDTAFLAGVDQLTRQADSNFSPFKGPEKEEALVYDSKVQLTADHHTTLKKHALFNQYDMVDVLYSGDSRREAEKAYNKYEKLLTYYWGSRAYSKKYRASDTAFLQQTIFSKKLLNGYERYRTTLAAYISQQTHQYEVALVIEGGPKPACTFIKPDTAQTERNFRGTVQYLLSSFNNNKAVENIAGESLSNDSTLYKPKYCFNHATCYLLSDTYEPTDNANTMDNQRKYRFSAEYRWLNAKQADSLFNELSMDISNSLNGDYVRYERMSELARLLSKKSIAFAADRDHLMPFTAHFISLYLDDHKNNDYAVRIEIE